MLGRPSYAVLDSRRLEGQKRSTTTECEAARPTIWPFLDKQDKRKASVRRIHSERYGLPRKSRNSLRTEVGVEPLFMLSCDRSPVMLTWLRQFTTVVWHTRPWPAGRLEYRDRLSSTNPGKFRKTSARRVHRPSFSARGRVGAKPGVR